VGVLGVGTSRTSVFRFGAFELDPKSGELWKAGVCVKLPPQPFKVLALLARRPGELVTRKEIQQQIWGSETFVDFEEGLNFCIKQIRTTLGDDAETPRYIETLPRRGYRFITPVEEPGRPAGRTMLAVLPFENLSGDPEQDYFSDGLTEEMITQLGRLQPERLSVIARTSAMTYKGSNKTVDQIGRELGVDYLLEGSVRREGDQVRITAQLIQVRDQAHLWAQSYDRNVGSILAVQGEVARAIAGEIKIAVTPEETKRLASARPVNPDAYEAYLKGRFHWYKLSRVHLDTALEYFQLAREKDPNYALAYVGIAYVWASRGDCGLVSSREAFPKVKAAALKARELDDTLAEVHELLANVRFFYEWDWGGAEREFQRAIQLNSNSAELRFYYSDFLISMRRPQGWKAEIERALELDPFNFFLQCFFGWHLLYLRRYDEAILQLRKALCKEPNFPAAHLALWGAFHRKGMYEEALAEAKKFFLLLGSSEVAEALARGYADSDYRGAMRLAAEKLAARSKQAYIPTLRIARLYAHAGEKDRALEWLEKAYEEREPPLVHLRVGWDWHSLRDDPRFQSLLRRLNFPP
jgi:TolB-like protein/Tfp pilus assembly protein PilF